jgi:hypothetical protein
MPHAEFNDTVSLMTDGTTKGTKETKERKTLACGCQVDATRDFLGRVVGTVITKGDACGQTLHAPGQVIVMPGREHARP